MIKVAKFVGKF